MGTVGSPCGLNQLAFSSQEESSAEASPNETLHLKILNKLEVNMFIMLYLMCIRGEDTSLRITKQNDANIAMSHISMLAP